MVRVECAIFGLFGKKQRAARVATITFDEAYCHSAANPAARIYQTGKGTTDLRVVFPDFAGFWQRYINRNDGLSDDTLLALRDGGAVFVVSVVEGGEYRCHDGVGDDGSITLHAANLMGMGTSKPFAGFSGGALAFGIYQLGAFRFELVWAMVYED